LRLILSVCLAIMLLHGCKTETALPEPEPKASLFPPESACNYPQSAPGSLFRRLGGGQWSTTDQTAAQPRYECIASTPVVQLSGDADSPILVEYSATGVRNGASMVKLTYTADASVAHETTHRNTFANLAEVITKTALEAPLPDLFRKKVTNLESFYRTGKDTTETFDIGRGFVLVNRERSPDKAKITVTVRVYSDIAFKLRS
jgi:hypothetical protein